MGKTAPLGAEKEKQDTLAQGTLTHSRVSHTEQLGASGCGLRGALSPADSLRVLKVRKARKTCSIQ